MRDYTQEEADQLTDRLTAKADRLDTWSASNQTKAEQRHDASRAATAGIPFGQPILSGHHSAKGHRRALERSRNNMDKAVEHGNKAKKQSAKADRLRATSNEAQRRAGGARYNQGDLEPGDRVGVKGTTMTGVLVRANAKSVTVWCCHSHDFEAQTEPRPIWPQFEDKNPQRYKYLAVHVAYRLIDGEWTELGGAQASG